MEYPELELPVNADLSARSLSMLGRPAVRLPGIYETDSAGESVATGRREAQLEYARDVRIAHEITRQQTRLSKNRAVAKERAAQRQAQQRTKLR